VQPEPAARPAPEVQPEPASRPAEQRGRARSRKTSSRRKLRRFLALAVVVVMLAAGGAVGYRMLKNRDDAHVVLTPPKLLGYVQQPSLAKQMHAQQLRADIVKKGNGEASHVVDAVYGDASSKPVTSIILFIGGNLSGSSSAFIDSFTAMGVPGTFSTSAGSMGGQAACVPSSSGHPAECAWADNDTFGLIASASLDAEALAKELRQVRPLVEHKAH
jgi:hypothetical protein